MKILLLILSTLVGSHTLVSSFYQFSFQTLDGSTVNTSAYKEKKVVIAVVGANQSGSTLVRFLDSVQNVRTGLQVIAVPTNEFGSSVNSGDLSALKESTSIVITEPLQVKKSNGSLQHPLFGWLTHAEENTHFDMDVTAEGQLFVISAKGSLYAVCSEETEKGVLLSLLDQPVNE